MINLVFQTLTVEHFRCFAAKQTFNLSPGPGLWFLRGKNEVEPTLSSNGSGKSTLMEALCWCISGETSKGLKNPDIKPWVGKGTPTVELRFLKKGEPHSIQRQAVTNGLKIDGVEAGPGEAEKLLGLPLQVLLNTGLFAQGAPLFLDKTPKEKFNLFADVLPLERWENRSKRAGERVKELERLEAEMLGEVSGLRSALDQTGRLLERTLEDSKDWEFVKEEEDKGRQNDIELYEQELARLQPDHDEVELAHDQAWVRLREMRADVGKLQRAQNEAQQKFNAWEFSQETAENDLNRLKKELSKLEEAKTCPTCGQPVKKTNLKEHKKELEAQIEEAAGKIHRFPPDELSEAFDEACENLSKFQGNLNLQEKATDELQAKLLSGKTTIESLKAKLTAAKDAKNREQRNPYTDQIVTLKQQKRKTTQEINILEEDILTAKKQIERTFFWIKGFRDVGLYLIEEALAEVEAVSNSLLTEIGLVGWRMEYDVEREAKSGSVQRGINVVVVPPAQDLAGRGKPGLGKVRRGAAWLGEARHGVGEEGPKQPSSRTIKWESWSGGEGQRLRLVGALALADVLLRHAGVSTNLEVFDEPTTHLSAAGVADLCSYLAERAKTQGKTIFLIDHLAREGVSFAGTVTVTKTAKGSVIQ